MALVHRPSPPHILPTAMGTVVEHPLSALGEIQNNLDVNSTRNSVEIIDVDAHDEPPSSPLSQTSSRPRPALRPRHSFHPDSVISLVDDSDDEVQILSDPIQGTMHETTNRRRLRSPPYTFMNNPPPPVPSVPRRYASFTSLPTSRAPHLSALPVRPNPQPFDFEQNHFQRDQSLMASIQRPFLPPSRRTTVPPQATGEIQPAAPPSHHLPSMGLGGALISSNNARVQQAAAHAARAATRMSHAIRRRPMSWLVTANFEDLFHDDVDNPPHIRRWIESQRDNFVRLYHRFRDNQDEPPSKYHQRYTHPDPPEPGFTFDFAPNSSEEDSSQDRRFPPTSATAPIIVDDDDEQRSILPRGPAATSSKMPTANTKQGKLSTILVCAKCRAPLILNESLGPDDSARRVWALRCGHMIDEQCLYDIGQPDEEAGPDNNQDQQTVVDRKGKGKAKARPRVSYGEAPVAVPEPTNIRSRLRSATTAVPSSSASSSVPPPIPLAPTKRRRAAVVNKVEAEFEWKCPVPSCLREHASVKIDGKWGPEKEAKQTAFAATKSKARGAFPVFA